ncbi:MAG: hypothetical protein K2W80_00415 [Burkholderiales bacterium]|nr:hypothetical protein [Burkholderiales bacterium]
MKELDLLREIGRQPGSRSATLIVPQVSYLNGVGSLNNDGWAFTVPYAFREALDLKYVKRSGHSGSAMVWTQGAAIAFRASDVLYSKDERTLVQIINAEPVSWDANTRDMKEGYVSFTSRDVSSLDIWHETVTTQLGFLAMLITGRVAN